MGRLPDNFAGKKIYYREPYEIAAEVDIASAESKVFPPDSLTHNVDKPFEIHRTKPFVVPLDNNNDIINFSTSDQFVLQSLLRVKISDLGKTLNMQKSSTRVSLIPKGAAEATWEWAEPYTIVRAEGFQIDVTADSYVHFAQLFTKLRLCWKFEGFLLIQTPPSESR